MPLSFSQLGKVHRKHATFEVIPAVLIEGRRFQVSIQPWQDVEAWRVVVISNQDEVVVCKNIKTGGTALGKVIELPDGVRGGFRVSLEMQSDGLWLPVAQQGIVVIPEFLGNVRGIQNELEEYERASEHRTKRAAWALLAQAEDLLERARKSETGHVWDIERRLTGLRASLQQLKDGNDPLSSKTGYALRGYRSPSNGEIQLYSMYVSKSYSPDEPMPLVVMLHGAWSNHHNALRRVMGKPNKRGEDDDAAKRVMPSLPDVPYLVVAPNGFETMSYEGVAEQDVWIVMDEVRSLYNVDPDRIYLTGLSMGGAGTGKFGFRHAHLFAAIAPVCGYFDTRLRSERNNAPPHVQRLYDLNAVLQVAENVKHVPVKLMHGDVDPVVPPQNSRDMYSRLQELGYRSELEMYRGVDHDAWTPAYENARIFDWFSQFKRDPYPKEIVYKTGEPYGGAAYWVKVLELETIRRFARVDAKVEGGAIRINTENVQRLAVTLPVSIMPKGIEDITLQIDGTTVLTESSSGDIFFGKTQDGWQVTQDDFTHRLLPLNNGIDAARNAKHFYVYSGRNTKETEEARLLALKKSNYGELSDVRWQVLPEESVGAFGSNLVIFSTLEGSGYLMKNLDHFPVTVDGGKMRFGERVIERDQAFAFVYPNPANRETYVMVNTALTLEGLKGLRAFSENDRGFRSELSGDFVCFDQDGNKLWGGLFDKDWNVELIEAY